jgi:hypothetical protein
MSSIISWKGKTLNQTLTTVRKNENSTIITAENMHRSPPLKIYRKETNSNVKSKSSKIGITINLLLYHSQLYLGKCKYSNNY